MNIEIRNFEPPKNDLSLRMHENIRVPHHTLGTRHVFGNVSPTGIGCLHEKKKQSLSPVTVRRGIALVP